VFFFHRYASALNGAGWLAIAVNAMLFATMHAILFASRGPAIHWEAVTVSFIGGLIFACRFVKTRSFLAVWLEHALYGDLIFTIGLGRFFFTGVANL
jgi:membrane protease YdiL (CAAX protease family)